MTATIEYFKSQNPVDGDAGGGIMSDNLISRTAMENIFRHISGAERTAGATLYRKIWPKKVSGISTLTKFLLDRLSTSEDRFQIKAGGYEDTTAYADDIGWTETNITWTAGTRKITMANPHAALSVGELILVTTSGGAFRGMFKVASYIDTTNFTVSAAIRGSDPANTDTVRAFWIGSGDLKTAITGGTTSTVVADFEDASGIYVGMLLALVDWDHLDGNGQRTVEFCTVTGVAWNVNEATITVSSNVVGDRDPKTKGSQTGTADENFDLNGLTLLVSVDGAAYQTVTFESDGMTAAQVATFINDNTTGCTASASGTKVKIETDSYYAENSIQLGVDSTALTELGLDSTIHNGTTGTVVCGVLEHETLAASHSTPVKTSAAGVFTDNIVDYDVGAIYDVVTVTFTSATEFTVAGVNVPYYGAGDIATVFRIGHLGSYYFEIPTSCWGGVWALGDTMVFTTYPAAKPIWIKEVVPAGAAAASLNRAHLSSYASW